MKSLHEISTGPILKAGHQRGHHGGEGEKARKIPKVGGAA